MRIVSAKQFLALILVEALMLQPLLGSIAIAAPEDAKVVAGDVSIQTNDLTTLIHASDGSIIDYSSFDIHIQETVQFVQPGTASEKRVKKPQMGHFRKAGVRPSRILRESRLDDDDEVETGQTVRVEDVFAEGAMVDVIGTSKGRGFAGTIKRHGFSRGPASHGSKNIREPGSTGAHTYPGRVFKGKKMAGQMGNKRRTVKNLTVVRIDAEKNRLMVRGAVPGPNGGIVLVQAAKTPPPPSSPTSSTVKG